jgi:hypothetical protein
MLELIGTPYLGAIIPSLELLATEPELATFGLSEELAAEVSVSELSAAASDEAGFSAALEVASAELPPSVEALEPGGVTALEAGWSTEALDTGSSDAVLEAGSSQLAQKKAVTESRTFFQCLYNI